MVLDSLRFLAAHQPLRSINRFRKTVYGGSQKKRNILNAKTLKNVENLDEIPSGLLDIEKQHFE